MRPKGSAEKLERRRRRAVQLLKRGKGVCQVARLVGAAPGSVVRWRDAYARAGARGLAAKPHPGRRPRLTPDQRQALIDMLDQGVRSHGYRTGQWTLVRVAELIHRHFGVHYDPSHVWRILHALGWKKREPTPQTGPGRRAKAAPQRHRPRAKARMTARKRA